LLGDEPLVQSVVKDFESSALHDQEKVLFRFLAKVNHQSAAISAEDLSGLHHVGWTDEAIYYAVTVCALFNFYNRWVDATGVHPMSDQAHALAAKRSAVHGYVRK
jgi:alkylhydroperoxidase family enzyme